MVIAIVAGIREKFLLPAIAAALRAEINRETGRVHCSETTQQIPSEDCVSARHEWEV